jgi:hypothetical protein
MSAVDQAGLPGSTFHFQPGYVTVTPTVRVCRETICWERVHQLRLLSRERGFSSCGRDHGEGPSPGATVSNRVRMAAITAIV